MNALSRRLPLNINLWCVFHIVYCLIKINYAYCFGVDFLTLQRKPLRICIVSLITRKPGLIMEYRILPAKINIIILIERLKEFFSVGFVIVIHKEIQWGSLIIATGCAIIHNKIFKNLYFSLHLVYTFFCLSIRFDCTIE